jgi:hypothetical protein
MSAALRVSDLSPARQALVRLCQAINHGNIEDLEVRRSEPVFDPAPVMVKDVKLDRDDEPRPELELGDFTVSDEVSRLLVLLDKLESGSVRFIEIRAGLPRRVVFATVVLNWLFWPSALGAGDSVGDVERFDGQDPTL